MEVSEDLLCLFNAEVTVADDEYVVRVPTREVEAGTITPGDVYRVALVARRGAAGADAAGGTAGVAERQDDDPQPPVEPGEIRYVEVEDLGKQGDGIARVERGYVIIVPGAAVGDRVKVEVTEVESNFAVAEVLESAD